MITQISTWILIFLAYSVAGWVLEIIVTIIQDHKIYNRGFLIGPVCPIYGVGGLAFSLLLPDTLNPVLVFLSATVLGAVIEYLISVVMEKLFHARWWDYSNRPFNLKGRICLLNSLFFGFCGLLLVFAVTPFFLSIITSWPHALVIALASVGTALLLIDLAISLKILINHKTTVKLSARDGSEEIAKRVQKILYERSIWARRLIKAFPNHQPTPRSPKTHRKNSASDTVTNRKVGKKSKL